MGNSRTHPRPIGTTIRGQTAYDFAIGVSIFLVVVTGVVAFVPSMIAGQDSPGGGNEVIASERAAAYLVEDGLSSPDRPYALDEACVVAFFDDTRRCGFRANNALTEDIGITSRRAVNVTIEADVDTDGTREPLCWTGSDVAELGSCGAGDLVLTGGSDADLNQEYAEATRVGRIRGQRVFVVVRVW